MGVDRGREKQTGSVEGAEPSNGFFRLSLIEAELYSSERYTTAELFSSARCPLRYSLLSSSRV